MSRHTQNEHQLKKETQTIIISYILHIVFNDTSEEGTQTHIRTKHTRQ